MTAPLRWYRSVAVKSFAVAFVATHVPLLALIALVVLAPDWLSPLGVLAWTLVATLVATALVITVLWRLFRPLRQAADGLRDFMLHGKPPRLTSDAGDEVGRLVRVLVQALAHLDRGRAPLLQAGALTLEGRTRASGLGDDSISRTMALVEIDQWPALDQAGSVERMQDVQSAMSRALAAMLRGPEVALPWGRGRFLVVLDSSGSDALDRLEPVCTGFSAGAQPQLYSCCAAVEPRDARPRSWAATLQRLEHKLFALRLEGRTAQAV